MGVLFLQRGSARALTIAYYPPLRHGCQVLRTSCYYWTTVVRFLRASNPRTSSSAVKKTESREAQPARNGVGHRYAEGISAENKASPSPTAKEGLPSNRSC